MDKATLKQLLGERAARFSDEQLSELAEAAVTKQGLLDARCKSFNLLFTGTTTKHWRALAWADFSAWQKETKAAAAQALALLSGSLQRPDGSGPGTGDAGAGALGHAASSSDTSPDQTCLVDVGHASDRDPSDDGSAASGQDPDEAAKRVYAQQAHVRQMIDVLQNPSVYEAAGLSAPPTNYSPVTIQDFAKGAVLLDPKTGVPFKAKLPDSAKRS